MNICARWRRNGRLGHFADAGTGAGLGGAGGDGGVAGSVLMLVAYVMLALLLAPLPVVVRAVCVSQWRLWAAPHAMVAPTQFEARS